MEKEDIPQAKEEGAVSPPKTKRKTVRIDIYKAWCKSCGICVAFCPTEVLTRDETGSPCVKDLEKCINCGWCEIRCPDFAITVQTELTGKRRAEKESEETSEGVAASGQ